MDAMYSFTNALQVVLCDFSLPTWRLCVQRCLPVCSGTTPLLLYLPLPDAVVSNTLPTWRLCVQRCLPVCSGSTQCLQRKSPSLTMPWSDPPTARHSALEAVDSAGGPTSGSTERYSEDERGFGDAPRPTNENASSFTTPTSQQTRPSTMDSATPASPRQPIRVSPHVLTASPPEPSANGVGGFDVRHNNAFIFHTLFCEPPHLVLGVQ